MNLLCPNCQKQLQVPEQYAGQAMKCPLCAGTFTVPALPSSVAAGSGASPGPFAPPSPPQVPSNAYSSAPPQGPAAPPGPAPAPGTFTRTRTWQINPRIMRWLMPVSAALILALTFFPWYGLYPGGTGVYTQNAWQAAFGGGTPYDIWVKMNTQMDRPGIRSDQVGTDVPLIFYLLALPLGLLLLAGMVVFNLNLVPATIPPALKDIWPWRTVIVGGLFFLMFVLLLMQMVVGFSLEHYVRGMVQEQVERTLPRPITDEDHQMVELAEGISVGAVSPGTTIWLRLVILLHVVILIGAALEFWLERRGAKPLPQLEMRW